jgi:L-rhamnose-H+ transport protein
MLNSFLFGVLLIIVAAICNSCFAIPLRHTRGWKWENMWLVFAIFSLLVLPGVLVSAFVRGAVELFQSVPLAGWMPALVFGFVWGIAQAGFGVAIRMLGIAVALPVIGAMNLVLGALIPAVVQHPADLVGKTGVVLFGSCALLIAGLALYSRAIRIRDRATAGNTTLRGMLLCLLVGVTGGANNIGFSLSAPIIHRAEALGNTSLTSTYPVWMVLLAAGFVPNLLYCGYLLRTNRTGRLFSAPGAGRDFARAITMAVLWIVATFSYGVATQYAGKFGTTIGFLMYGSFTMIFANVIGWKDGEWRGVASQAVRLLWIGMALMLASICILGFTM